MRKTCVRRRRLTVCIPVTILLFALVTMMAQPVAGQPMAGGSPAVVEGTVVMLVEDDFATGRATRRYFLDHSGGHGRYDLALTPQQAATVQPGMQVRVTGRLAGHTLAADSTDHGVVVLEAAAASTPTAARKVLVLLVDITDASSVTHSISATCDGPSDVAAAATFGFNTTAASVDGCYQDSSFGQLGVGGAFYPGTDVDVQRVSITDSVTACNYTSWGNKADAAAANLGDYQHRVYVVPSDVACSWAGLAYVNSCPGTNCRAWVKAYGGQPCGYPDAITHEVGHNLGLMHSSTDFNNDNTLDCEYCDDSDFMGYAEGMQRPLNGPHKVQMGWVSGSGIVDASAGGLFTLSPLGQPGAPLPRVAKITPFSGNPYYISYRIASGYDAFLSSTAYSSGLLGRISIHRWPGGITNTRLVASLADGQSFSDGANSLMIVQNSHSSTSVTFTVSVGLWPPTNLQATPGDSQVALSWTASAGATGYKVKRATVSGGPYTTVASVTTPSHLDTGLTNGQPYYYVVSALNGTSETANSAQVSATPDGVDLVESAVGNPPAGAAPGTSFSATDTVKNQGAVTAGASTTRYYLSTDTVKGAGDILLNGSRSVPSLAGGQSSSGSASVTIPAGTALGTYFLLACADELNAAVERNEGNNCLASAATVTLALADLAQMTVSNPPATATSGGTIRVTDTVKNQGTVPAGASTTRYYLSAGTVKNVGDILLGGSRSVPSLAAGQTSKGNNVRVSIPTTAAGGPYYLLVCADDLNALAEANEANNCRASTSTVLVQ